MQVYKFGPFCLDSTERRLLKDGQPVSLKAKVFDLLLVLVGNDGRLVRKEDLMKAVWVDSFVEDNNLTVGISALRKALGENSSGQQYIETVPRLGYRFVANVQMLNDSNAAPQNEGWNNSGGGDSEWSDEVDGNLKMSGLHRSIGTMAVLPFEIFDIEINDQYYSAGIADALVTKLSRIKRLNVLSTRSGLKYSQFRHELAGVRQPSRVNSVLEGQLQKLGNRIRVSVQLISTQDERLLWAETFDGEYTDTFTIQDFVSEQVAQALRLRLSGNESKLPGNLQRGNTKAQQSYVKGRYFWNKYTEHGLKKAVEFFQQAVAAEPDYALGYAGLADAYLRLSDAYLDPHEALPKANAAARKALELDDTLAECHLSMGAVRMYSDYDWIDAKREYQRAIELDPYNAAAHQCYGTYLMCNGFFDEAATRYELAQRLDPHSLLIGFNAGVNFYLSRQYKQAVNQLLKTLEINPYYSPARIVLGRVYTQTQNYPDAALEFEEAYRMREAAHSALSYRGYAYAVSGQRKRAEESLRELKEIAGHKYVSPYSMAIIYAGLGEKERAFEQLETACEERNDLLFWLKAGPELDILRADPRFSALLQGAGIAP